MLSGITAVLEAFDLSEVLHWKLYYDSSQAGVNPIATSIKEGNFSLADSRARLQKVLNSLQPANYRIEFKDTWDKPKSYTMVKFDVRAVDSQNASIPAIAGVHGLGNLNPSEYVHKDDIKKTVRELMAHEKMKDRLEELEEEVKQYQKDSLSSSIAGVFNNYGHILIPAIANKLGIAPQAVGVAGFDKPKDTTATVSPTLLDDGEESEEEETELDTRMKAVLVKIVAMEGSDEAAVSLLEHLLVWIEQNPTLYQSLKPTILNTKTT